MNRPFSLLIKPASADCNLGCDYCFYHSKSSLYPETPRHRMSDTVLEQLVKSYMATRQPVYAFGWQGGEPTLMDLEFFEKVIRYQKKFGRTGASVGNGIQTNAILIDAAMAQHFAEYRYLVGCSLDGPPEIHNRFRRFRNREPSFDKVLQGIGHLQRKGVAFNILVLVSQANANRSRDVYHDLIRKGFLFHQYIPCVEFDTNGSLQPYAISGEEWGRFLCGIFDGWYPADTRRVSIRHFDAILSRLVDQTADVCTMGNNCCQYFVVEYNGDVYPCDFFVEPSLKLGNIMENSWTELLASPLYQHFGQQKQQWHQHCSHCDHLSLCQGDCLKHRLIAGSGPDGLSHLCSGWKLFFDHTRDAFESLAEKIRQERRQTHRSNCNQAIQPTRRFGRNDPCPCGSALKYKKCCGR